MKNKIMCLFFVILLLLTVISLTSAKETLRVSTWGGLYQSCYEEGCNSFEEEYDVEIEWVLGEMTQWTTMARMGQLDVVTSDWMNSLKGEKEGIYLTLDETTVPNLANVYDIAKQLKTCVWTNVGDSLIAYNTKYIESPPTSWLDLWDDKYQQRVAIYKFNGTATLSLVVLLAEMEGGGIDNIQPGIDKLLELYKKGNIIAMTTSDAETQNLVLLEEAWLAVMSNGRALALIEEGADFIGISRPKEGTFGQISTIQVAKTTKKPDLAMAFVNHVLTPECQEIFAARAKYSPTVNNATIPEELKGILLSGEAIENLYIPDWIKINELREEWDETWQRAITNIRY